MCSSRISCTVIHAHIADLHFFRDATEGDDGPVLKISLT